MKLSFLTKRTMSLAALFGAAFGAEVTTDWQPGICWDVNNQDSLNMIMYQCHGGSNQDFYYDSETAEIKVTSHPNTCMDYNLGSSNVYFFDCHGNSNQKWYYTQDTKEVKSVYKDYCLDYNYNDGNLYMSPCNGGANQRFNFPGGFFQALSTNSGDVPDFCWKDAYGRGVGTIPDGCPDGREKIGLLCYSSCPAGMYRWGFDCHASCPDGFRDEGLFCRRDAYGRGAGYPAWDWGRCESDNGAGNCEWWGAVIYPKCAEGYHNSACCICSPNDIDCNSFPGMSEVPDFASCAKQIIIGDPTPMTCPAGKENSGGLCYDPCSPGYWGAGPVCWGQVPPSMVDCGMGAASNVDNCVQAISDQIQSVFELTREYSSLSEWALVVIVILLHFHISPRPSIVLT